MSEICHPVVGPGNLIGRELSISVKYSGFECWLGHFFAQLEKNNSYVSSYCSLRIKIKCSNYFFYGFEQLIALNDYFMHLNCELTIKSTR